MNENRRAEIEGTRAKSMIGVVDVQYSETHAIAAMVCVDDWEAAIPVKTYTIHRECPEAYEPGQFFRRELPCLLDLIESSNPIPTTVVVDGYVWLDNERRKGLGAKLYDARTDVSVVIGVAKTKFRDAPAIEILRGQSRTPLYVSAVGVPVEEAAEKIQKMHGPFRIPTILRTADQMARQIIR